MARSRWWVASIVVAVLLTGCARWGQDAPALAESPMSPSPKKATLDGTHQHVLVSESIGQRFSIDVWQPLGLPGPFPVVYVTDGNVLFGTAIQHVSPMIYTGDLPPVVVVGIGYETQSPLDVATLRTRDFLPTEVEGFAERMAAAGMPLPPGVGPGGADAFLAFIEEEVKPFVEARYPVDPTDETLVGHSYGGVFATHVLLSSTGSFDRYVIGSPALAWDDGFLFEQEEAYASSHDALRATVFLSAGALEIDNGIRVVSERMMERLATRGYAGLTLRSNVFGDETHASSIGVTVSRGLRAVYGTWPATSDSKR